MVKWSRLPLLLVILSLFCFIFAGAVFAVDANMTVTADGEEFAYTGCTNSYIIEIDTIHPNKIMDASCFNQASGMNMSVGFVFSGTSSYATGFSFFPGMTVPVKIELANKLTGQDSEWLFAQPTLTWADTAQSKANLFLPNLQIANANNKVVKRIVIGDALQDLKVKNPCYSSEYSDPYCVKVDFDPVCSFSGTLERDFTILPAPASVTADMDCTCSPVTSCNPCITVNGNISTCGGELLTWNDVDVILEKAVYDNCQIIRWDPVAGVTGTLTWDNTLYTWTVNSPLDPGTYRAHVTATNLPCGVPVTDTPVTDTTEDNILVNASTPSDSASSKGLNIAVTNNQDAAGDNDVRFNKCNDLTVSLLSACQKMAAFSADTKVFISATQLNNLGVPIVAGHFYEVCTTDPLPHSETGQLDGVQFLAFDPQCPNKDGVYSKNIVFVPLVDGPITIKVWQGSLKNELVVNSVKPNNIAKFEITPLVTDKNGNPVAGWPLAAKVMLDFSASEDYAVTFAASNAAGPVSGVSFDDEQVKAFVPFPGGPDCPGDNGAIFPYCTDKQYFFLYPDTSVVGKTLTFTVDVDGIEAVFTMGKAFVSPVEMQRTFKENSWQVFSVPKYVAKECAEAPNYATFEDALPFDPLVLTYNNQCGPFGWTVVNKDSVMDPLNGYYVKVPQIEAWENQSKTTVDFVFARAVDPSQQYPPTEWMTGQGWNTVGVAVSPTFEKTLARQSDTAAHAFGSLVEKGNSYNIWNPGTKLGNVNTGFTTINLSPDSLGSYAGDSMKTVYNGDVYWIWGSQGDGPNQDQTYVSNLGLDIIEWVGGQNSV
ncbi:MAG: hypothetical protein ACYDEQ_15175 [Desulfocucumaceae bacterium]